MLTKLHKLIHSCSTARDIPGFQAPENPLPRKSNHFAVSKRNVLMAPTFRQTRAVPYPLRVQVRVLRALGCAFGVEGRGLRVEGRAGCISIPLPKPSKDSGSRAVE